ncbi:THAP9 [Mytilus coruscus]|uniref:THAP9 n=1 Tax=Mytilus coruscus TaxID=42192 RepID=A0A6J8D8F8_MYTCO|nr:THAP9 [Mytilus coruscus]
MEEISVAVSIHTEDEKDEPCLNQDTSLLEFVRSEEISIASGEDKGELLLDEHSDHTYAAKEQPFENEKTCTLEFDCHADFFLAPLEGTEQQITQEIEIYAVNETHHEHEEACLSPFQTLCNLLQVSISDPYILSCTDTEICIVELYQISCREMSIKLSVIIDSNFCAKIYVHRKEVSRDNDIWTGLPTKYDSVEFVTKLLSCLSCFSVCVGNPDEEYQYITPVGCGISDKVANTIRSYREGNFSATSGTLSYGSTIRSVHCSLLVKGKRCSQCLADRRMLRKRHQRAVERHNSPPTNFVHKTVKHENMSRSNLIEKINQQRDEIKSMSSEIEKLKRKCKQEILQDGVTLDLVQNIELKDLMSTCNDEFKKAYPDPNSVQRLFWEQQCKFETFGKNGMRWHPMIIRWCLYMRNKSAKAYDAMRDSGFIQLPSARTLFDYSHYTKSALGFQPDVTKMLHEEAKKLENYKNYVGLLFDEIRIKEDLVYDKHTGELIGYCDLDSISNQIMNLEKAVNDSKPTQVAKFMLVIMVRGITTNLKFPFAGFATNSITADFLYPIFWKAVSILECSVKLKVLFCTCDGASANRKFFQLHKLDNSREPVYFTKNPHDENRNLYFISDVPHLLKTARNCLSNSYSHKKTRQLWKREKDISWMHLVRLFEEHCEQDIYSPCPKLSRTHIDLTAFSYMKVNLAAQILSGTVANALEHFYDESVSETVCFIRHFNRFFDCLNVRSLFEGRNKRNPDLDPYTDVNDNRLEWLTTSFLGYFEEWRQNIENRNIAATATQKAAMTLSRQTLDGLKISVKSITECVKFMLGSGADFILTHHFNQDPLEQHFGHYRHKSGANNNPTVYDVRNMMTTLRAVGSQALQPRRGNISVNRENIPVDNTKLPRRR